MTQIPNCPNCQSEYAYEDRGLFVCHQRLESQRRIWRHQTRNESEKHQISRRRPQH